MKKDMKKDIPIIFAYKSKNYNHANKPLINKFPLISNLNFHTSFNTNNKCNTKSTNEISYTKNTNANTKNYSYSQHCNQKKLNKNYDSKLFNIFKPPKEKSKKQFNWPKITQSKLPFSKREKIPEEERKKQMWEQKPNRIYHDFYMIKWLRNKYSDSLIERSVFSMLPDNGKPVVPDDESEGEKKHRLLLEYLDSLYKKVPEKEKYVKINPKYFFDQKTFKKILKFREIFLEFDEDQSRKMEIDEMVEMFNQNHINASLEDLKNLFFKDKKVNKEDIMKLYLDFYQFMNFALTKDQDFRNFMREIKERNKKKEKKLRDKKNEEEDEGEDYLPMNFNLMFDYFLMKGKERASIDEIEKSIKEMDKIINNHKMEKIDDEKKIHRRNSKHPPNNDLNKNKSTDEDIDININYEEQLKNLNFKNIIDNFITLFHINGITSQKGKEMSDSFVELAASHEQNSGIKNLKAKEDNNIKTSMFTENDVKDKELKNKKMKKNLTTSLDSNNDKTIENFIEYNINRKILKNLNMNNYKKFHDVNLALTETKKSINSFIKSMKNKNNVKKNNFFNDNSLIGINKDVKISYIEKNKNKEHTNISINPLYVFDKSKNYNSKNYSNTAEKNLSYNKRERFNNNNINIINSEISSVQSYMSKQKNKNKKSKDKYDFVPPDLLKENKKNRYFRFFV